MENLLIQEAFNKSMHEIPNILWVVYVSTFYFYVVIIINRQIILQNTAGPIFDWKSCSIGCFNTDKHIFASLENIIMTFDDK